MTERQSFQLFSLTAMGMFGWMHNFELLQLEVIVSDGFGTFHPEIYLQKNFRRGYPAYGYDAGCLFHW